jgi:hypothetical protein
MLFEGDFAATRVIKGAAFGTLFEAIAEVALARGSRIAFAKE